MPEIYNADIVGRVIESLKEYLERNEQIETDYGKSYSTSSGCNIKSIDFFGGDNDIRIEVYLLDRMVKENDSYARGTDLVTFFVNVDKDKCIIKTLREEVIEREQVRKLSDALDGDLYLVSKLKKNIAARVISVGDKAEIEQYHLYCEGDRVNMRSLSIKEMAFGDIAKEYRLPDKKQGREEEWLWKKNKNISKSKAEHEER